MSRHPRSRDATPLRPLRPLRPLWQRLAWLLGIWCASVTVLALFAWLLRQAMTAAGLSTP